MTWPELAGHHCAAMNAVARSSRSTMSDCFVQSPALSWPATTVQNGHAYPGGWCDGDMIARSFHARWYGNIWAAGHVGQGHGIAGRLPDVDVTKRRGHRVELELRGLHEEEP